MFKIADREIGPDFPPFIIAEMSGNHNQSLERAFQLVDAAVVAGAHAVKLQTASSDGLTLNVNKPDFIIDDKESLWHGRNLYELYQEAVTPWEWHKEIFDYCRAKGIIAFSSPFELRAVDFLEDLNVPCYKIASFELVDLHTKLGRLRRSGPRRSRRVPDGDGRRWASLLGEGRHRGRRGGSPTTRPPLGRAPAYDEFGVVGNRGRGA